jgi:hypothetical protein
MIEPGIGNDTVNVSPVGPPGVVVIGEPLPVAERVKLVVPLVEII